MKRITMNTTLSRTWGLAAATALLALTALPGCELLVQFDRGLIDGGAASDVTVPQGDGPTSEAAADATAEGATDAPTETGDGSTDAPPEARAEGGGPPDAPTDGAGDAPTDSPDEGSLPDTGGDGPTEAPTDDGGDAADSGGADGDDGG
jgi:hypothetical protein